MDDRDAQLPVGADVAEAIIVFPQITLSTSKV